jgi:molybdopterin synthase catalytic subunit
MTDASRCRREIRVSEADFDAGAELTALYARAGGALGAVATFVGLVRDQYDGERVSTLHLEHYPGMTERSIDAIVDKALARWPLLDVLVVHRVGALDACAQIVYVQVGSGHRDAAFAAAEFIMDYLKTEAVFWKRESGGNGERWVESTEEDRQRRAAWTDTDHARTDPARKN